AEADDPGGSRRRRWRTRRREREPAGAARSGEERGDGRDVPGRADHDGGRRREDQRAESDCRSERPHPKGLPPPHLLSPPPTPPRGASGGGGRRPSPPPRDARRTAGGGGWGGSGGSDRLT